MADKAKARNQINKDKNKMEIEQEDVVNNQNDNSENKMQVE